MATPKMTVAMPSMRNSLGKLSIGRREKARFKERLLPLPSGKASCTRYSVKGVGEETAEDIRDVSANVCI